MLVEFADVHPDGGMLYSLLDRHRLLPDSLRDPAICMLASERMSVGFIHEGGETPLAILLESYPAPGIVGLLFINERPRLNQLRDGLIECSLRLRKRWFEDLGALRVEARIPIERTQTIRCLGHLGFKQETLPKGLRDAEFYHGKATSMCVMGLLPSDPIKQLSTALKEPTIETETQA